MQALKGLVLGFTLALSAGAFAIDTLTLAIGQRGTWENSAPEVGQQMGIFEKHGLKLEILYTQGAGETIQAVLSNSADLGMGVGTPGVLAAYEKGAPIRALANGMTGASDLLWYVPANSPLQSFKDVNGKTVAYSTNGSSSNQGVLALAKLYGVTPRPVATGSPPSTFTQVMSGQVDVGWSVPTFVAAALKEKRIRMVARLSDVPALRVQTVRLTVSNIRTLAQKKEPLARFFTAYAETMEKMYSDPAAMKVYVEWAKVPDFDPVLRDQFYPKENLRPGLLSGVKEVMDDAVAMKFIKKPLTDAQFKELFGSYQK